MAKIKDVQFPLDLGIANDLQIKVSFGLEDNKATAYYVFRNITEGVLPINLSQGMVRIPSNIYESWGVDNLPIIEYVANQLKAELI